MHPFLLITGGDARFFYLAQGCIQSVRDKSEAANVHIAFLDLGCTTDQLSWLNTNVNVVRRVDWEFTYPTRDRTPPHLRIQHAATVSAPEYFPGYEVYLWIDADTWVQEWAAIRLFIEGARRRRGLAIVPELDRGSQLQYGGLPQHWQQIETWYSAAFGEKIGKRLCLAFQCSTPASLQLTSTPPSLERLGGRLAAATYTEKVPI